jgi:hypothetical protein
MRRTLTSCGLAVVIVTATALSLTGGTASARDGHGHGPHHLVLTGTWVDPGPAIDSVNGTAYPDRYLVIGHGGTSINGGFAGQSTYSLTDLFDVTTNDSNGFAIETFDAAVAGHGSGHVTFSERITLDGATGTEVISGPMVAGDGLFAGAHGYVRYEGSTDPSGPANATGTYRMWIDLAS